MSKEINKEKLWIYALGFIMFLLILSSMASPLMIYLILVILTGLTMFNTYMLFKEDKAEEEPKQEVKEEQKTNMEVDNMFPQVLKELAEVKQMVFALGHSMGVFQTEEEAKVAKEKGEQEPEVEKDNEEQEEEITKKGSKKKK